MVKGKHSMTDDNSYRYTLINDTIPVRFKLDGKGAIEKADIVDETGEPGTEVLAKIWGNSIQN